MPPSPLVVIVATRNRPALLRDRCLPSIAAQRRRPDEILIVDDSDPGFAADNARIVAEACAGGLPAVYDRTPRPSGAAASWNRTLRTAAARGGHPWIAIHDDDDQWTPDHLELCEATAAASDANVVVSGIRLVLDGVAAPQPLVQAVTIADFLRGNPGWQGSNTFIRLGLLLDVDGFDEQLGACLDRDLAIRVLDAGRARIAFTSAHTVDFYVDSDRPALSQRGSPSKLVALRHFFGKHRARMTPEDRAAFAERAGRLFGVAADAFEGRA